MQDSSQKFLGRRVCRALLRRPQLFHTYSLSISPRVNSMLVPSQFLNRSSIVRFENYLWENWPQISESYFPLSTMKKEWRKACLFCSRVRCPMKSQWDGFIFSPPAPYTHRIHDWWILTYGEPVFHPQQSMATLRKELDTRFNFLGNLIYFVR